MPLKWDQESGKPAEGVSAARHLEGRVLLSTSTQQLLASVEQLFKALPVAEHKATALKVCVCMYVCVCVRERE